MHRMILIATCLCSLLLIMMACAAPAPLAVTPTAGTSEPPDEPTVPADTPTPMPEPPEEPTEPADTPTPMPEPTGGPVAVLVVDAFTSYETVESNTESSLCAFVPGPTGYVSTGGGDAENHGHHVFNTVTGHLESVYGASLHPDSDPYIIGDVTAAVSPSGYFFQLWSVPQAGDVAVVAVDIKGFDVTVIRQRIEAAKVWAESNLGADTFVINMSWAILPARGGDACLPDDEDEYLDFVCEGIQNANDDSLGEIKRLLDSFALLDPSIGPGDIQQDCPGILGAPLSELRENEQFLELNHLFLLVSYADPACACHFLQYDDQPCQLLEEGQDYALNDNCAVDLNQFEALTAILTPTNETISVGAAGNSGLLVPYMPAFWDSVVSVSSRYAIDTVKISPSGTFSYQSNRGEVSEVGDSYMIPNTSLLTDIGTSYAAPRVSARMAVHLLKDGNATCDGFTPTLGIMPELHSERWEDIPSDEINFFVEDFATSFCGEWKGASP